MEVRNDENTNFENLAKFENENPTRRPLSSSNQVALIDSQADFQQLDSGNWRLRDLHNMKMVFGCHLFFQPSLENSI